MYSLDCNYYKKEFHSIGELINDVIMSGMDPYYEVTFNGVSINEILIDYFEF